MRSLPLFLAVLSLGAYAQAIEFGNITVVQPSSAQSASSPVTLSIATGSSAGFTLPAGSNRGDYNLGFGTANDLTTGVVISAVSQNGRDNSAAGDTFGTFHATSKTVNPNEGGGASSYKISIYRAAQGDEANINVSFGYFPFSIFPGGLARNAANNTALNSIVGSAGLDVGAVGSGAELTNTATGGEYLLDLRAAPFSAPADAGILLVTGGKDEDNYALSRANADGTFNIWCHDNGANGGSYEADPVAFVYLPTSAVGTNNIAALGRVNSDASTDVAAGTFSLTKGPTGLWYLTIPGHTNTTGVLLVSPEGGGTNTSDNIVSYEWDGANSRWIIQSRDLSGAVNLPTLQDGATGGEDVFSFVFLTTAPINVPPTVALTAPTDGATFTQGSEITLTANAADTFGGMVTLVEFFDGTTKIGEDADAPYSLAWNGAALGLRSLTAKATDNDGATATSTNITVTVQPPVGTGGLFFDGANDYVTFGSDPALGLAQFTLECWFRRDGAGVATSTGSGGVSAVPLIAKGRGENDSATFNCNYLLGIRPSDNVLVADFEEGPGGASVGLNHPVAGVTPITSGVWHHAAVTYDGTTWRLYLDGNLEATLAVGQPAAFDSIQHAAIGSALNSTGVADGYFLGVLDEVRIWNVARTAPEIAGTMNVSVPASTGLMARFGMDEGTGTTLTSTAAGAIAGALTNGPAWVAGTTLSNNVLPIVTLTSPINNATFAPGDTVSLEATATDSDGTVMTVEFFDGSTEIAQGNSAPYAAEWVAEGFGVHTFTARATDDDGGTAVSIPVTITVVPPTAAGALYFDGTNDYVSFGDAAALKLSAFTLETWVRREAGGAAATTGSGGVSGIPLIAKGRGENDTDTFNCNYFLGIHPTTGVLVADFEEGPAGTAPGLNHPITGNTALPIGEWHHVAATYDGTTWNLYIDGVLDASLTVGLPVAANSIQHASLGSALNSTGAPEGYLHGFLDETRVWNSARTIAEIQSTMNSEVAASSGLVARWAMTEGTGATVASTAGTTVDGTLTNGPLWTSGAPLTNDVPPTVTLVSPANGAVNQALDLNLQALVGDSDSGNLTVKVYGRAASPALTAPDFTIIALPDTQYYSAGLNGGTPAIFSAQTDWIVSELNTLNIQFVMHLGDITEHGDINSTTGLSNEPEWVNASNALYRLENPATTLLTHGVPYGVAVGNHDQTPIGNADGTTTFFNQYFGVHPTTGVNHFDGKPYYGGTQVPEKADNNYTLFSAGGLDFICISFEYDTSPDAADLAWADALLKAYPARRGIVITHWTVNTGTPATFSAQGQAIYNALKNNPNFMLMHGGHIHGEGRRSDTYAGRTVHSILADYQGRTRGGDGWLRLLEFSPANNRLRVKTYSPTLNQFETDADSQFELPVDLQSGLGPFTELATLNNVTPGTTISVPWNGLAAGTRHEWYVTVSDGTTTIASSTISFSTGGVLYPPTVSLTSPANGAYAAAPGSFTFDATAADADGTVDKVQFFSGTTLIGEDTTAPYSVNWTNVPAGSYTILAKATDNDGQVTISDPISVQVLTEPAAPSAANAAVGLFNANWVVSATTPAPRQFDLPGSDTGDIELRINGASVAFNTGLTLAANWNNPANAGITSEDNIVAPYANASGNALVSVIDNANNNAAGSNPATSEQSSGTAVAFLPFADGWVGASVSLNGAVLSGNLPAGVSLTKSGTGLYTVSGLAVTGNLLAFPNGNDPTTNVDNVVSVRVAGGTWVIDVRDNAAGAQDGDFSFVYIPSATTGVYSGAVSAAGTLTSLNSALTSLGASSTLGSGFFEITFGDGTLINPSTTALFLVGDSAAGGALSASADNLWSYEANGNAFRVFGQDLPELTNTFQAADFRFVAIPLGTLPVVTIAATDGVAGEFGADSALEFTVTRTGPTTSALTVPLSASGGAASGSDFTGFASSVVIPVGAASVTLPLTVLSDNFAEGDETVTVTVGSGGTFVAGAPASASATIQDRPAQNWYQQNIADPARRGPNDDADADGVSNVVEYFMGTQPGDASSRAGVEIEGGGRAFTVLYTRAKNRPDVSAQMVWSSDLTNWHASGESDGTSTATFAETVISPPAEDPEIVEVTVTVTGGGDPVPRIFVRLNIQ